MAAMADMHKEDILNDKVKLIATTNFSLSEFEQIVLKNFVSNSENLQSAPILGGELRKKLDRLRNYNLLRESLDKAGFDYIPGDKQYNFSVIIPAQKKACIYSTLTNLGYNVRAV